MKRILFFASCGVTSFLLFDEITSRQATVDPNPHDQNIAFPLNPPYIPTTGTLGALIVFVQFPDDTFDTPPACIADPVTGWPSRLHAVPNWATGNKLMHSQAKPPYTSGSMSDYYYVMSNGVFNFIGSVFPELYLTPEPKSYYDLKQKRGRGWLNQQIIAWMDNHSAYPVNFTDHDNDNDGDVDMIIFIYRNWDRDLFNRAIFQGVADLGFSGNMVRDGKTIRGGFPGSGISQHNVYTQEDHRKSCFEL